MKGNRSGDLHVTLDIETPATLSDAQRKALGATEQDTGCLRLSKASGLHREYGQAVMIRFLFLLFISMGCVPRSPAATQPDIVRRAQVMAQSDRMASIRLLEDELQSGRRDPSVEPGPCFGRESSGDWHGTPPRRVDWFEQLAARYPSHQLKDSAILGMAMVDAEKALSGNTLATMQLMDEQHVPDTMNADRYATSPWSGPTKAPLHRRSERWPERRSTTRHPTRMSSLESR